MPAAALRRRGLALLGVVLVADQLTKLWVLDSGVLDGGARRILPFLDVTLVWNRGISYGLLQTEGAGRWLLVGVTAIAIVALAIWFARARHPLVVYGLAAILGGAVGNLIDRLAYGAVVDFVHLHAGGYSWYVFNIADAAIVLGVIALVFDGFFRKQDTDS